MLTSITPVGEHARGQRWWVTATAYVVGSLAGGALVGGLLGVVSTGVAAVVPLRGRLVLLALVAVAGLVAERSHRGLPTRHRQVDERWLSSYRGWVYGLGFGLQLGAGVTTIVTSSATYVVLAAALLSGSVAGGVLVGGSFGLVRALPVLGFAGVRTAEGLRRAMRRMERLQPAAGAAATVVQVVVAGAAVAVAVRTAGA